MRAGTTALWPLKWINERPFVRLLEECNCVPKSTAKMCVCVDTKNTFRLPSCKLFHDFCFCCAGAQCSCIMFAFARFCRIFHCCSVVANEGDGVASRIGIQLLFVCAIICALQFTQRHRDTTTTIWSQMTNKEEKYKGRCNWIECWNMHLLCGYTAESGDSFVMEAENVRHWHCDT